VLYSLTLVVIALLALYVAAYAYCYSQRGPAANLAYFVYFPDESISESVEEAAYYFFLPVYEVHRLFGADRHNYDRPPLVFPPDFRG